MYSQLKNIHHQPKAFEFYTAEVLWNDPHISRQMLKFHLDGAVDLSSRRRAFIDRSIEWITAHFAVGAGTRICDFGCGPGLYTLGLAQKGAVVTGVDFSQNSIEYARQAAAEHGLAIQYVQQNYLQFETDEQFDLIVMIFCDFCVLSPQQRKILLQKFQRLLKAGGSVLFDAWSLPALEQRQEYVRYEHQPQGGFWSADEYFCFQNGFTYPEEKVGLDQYTIVQAERTWQVFNWLQYFSRTALADELQACGLEVAEWYGDVAGAEYEEKRDELAVVARKQ